MIMVIFKFNTVFTEKNVGNKITGYLLLDNDILHFSTVNF